MNPALLFAVVAAAAVVACSPPAPSDPAPNPASPAATVDTTTPPQAQITAPAGAYQLDPNHSSLSFRVNHLGLSNYVARFTRYDVSLKLDPDNLAASAVTAMIESTSVRTDYPGDYRATHKDSHFQSWEQDLAQSDKFLNAGQYPRIEFRSTSVEQIGPGAVRIVGDLTLLGQTRSVTLDARLVGSSATHPFTGAGALGFSATGTFQRSEFGMTHLLQPPLVGDAVTVQFEGEFMQTVAPAATPAVPGE